MIAAEYGWTINQILSLTIDQLKLMLNRIGERKKRDAITGASLMKFAISASLSKEGHEAFQDMVKEVLDDEPVIKIAKPEDLKEFGMGTGKD